MLAEPPRNTPELFCRLRYEIAADIISIFYNELLDFVLQGGNLAHGQRNLALSLPRPDQRPIKGLRCQIGREKRDGIKSGRSGRGHSGAQVTMIGLLHRGAAGYSHVRSLRVNSRDALTDYIEGSLHAPDCIVSLSRTVDRDDHLVEEAGNLVRALEQQQACR